MRVSMDLISDSISKYSSFKKQLKGFRKRQVTKRLKVAMKLRDSFLAEARRGEKGTRAERFAHLYDVVVADIETGVKLARKPVKLARKTLAQVRATLKPSKRSAVAEALFHAVEEKTAQHKAHENELKKTGFARARRAKKPGAIPDGYLTQH